MSVVGLVTRFGFVEVNDEGDRPDGHGVAIGEQDIFSAGDGLIAELCAVGAAEVAHQQSLFLEREAAMLSADVGDRDPELAVFAAADDRITAQADLPHA